MTELALGIALFHGFSKMLIALGLEPDHMDTTIVDTPRAQGVPLVTADYSDPHVALLEGNPELATRWQTMRDSVAAVGHVDQDIVVLGQDRIGQLLGTPWLADIRQDASGPEAELVLELAELFVIDVRAIDRDRLESAESVLGYDGTVQTVMALAVADGINRVAVTVGPLVSAIA